MSQASPPRRRSLLHDPHSFFFNNVPKECPETVGAYEINHLFHCRWVAAALGPDDWFVSKVDAYAGKSRLPHELLVLTLKKTPRMGQKPNPTEHKLALQRLMKPHRHVIQDMKNTDALSSTSQESWAKEWSPIAPIRSFHDVNGCCPANDGFQILPFVCYDYESKHIAQIHLPEPPCLLPATDYDAIIRNLDEEVSLAKNIRDMEQVKLNMEEERRASSPITSCQSSTNVPGNSISNDGALPHYVSLVAFSNLAWILHDEKQFYHHLSSDNCYWYTSMIMHALRLYTKQNIHVLGEKNVEIKWDEDLSDPNTTPLHSRALKEKPFFWERRYHPELSRALGIVNSPSNLAIRKVIVSWRRRAAEFYEKVYSGRLFTLRHRRSILDG